MSANVTRFAALSVLFLASACANPVVAPPVTPADAQKTCAALEQDIAEAARLKKAAREEDRFQWKYVFVVNAATSAYRMNKAEAAAAERIERLNRIMADRGCLGNQDRQVAPDTAPTPEPLVAPPANPTPQPVE